MPTKLTLRINKSVIRNAKRAAHSRGVSLSRMVADYFKAVAAQEENHSPESPVLAEIAGVLSPTTDQKKLLRRYRRHLEEKYR